MAPDGFGGTRERAESNGFVLGVQESIKLCAARFHAFGKLSLRDPLVRHQSIKLTSDHAFDRARGHFCMDTVLLEELIERRPDASLSTSGLFHVISFFRLIAISRSASGIFCVFFMKACRS